MHPNETNTSTDCVAMFLPTIFTVGRTATSGLLGVNEPTAATESFPPDEVNDCVIFGFMLDPYPQRQTIDQADTDVV
jgi:hypothetical protein